MISFLINYTNQYDYRKRQFKEFFFMVKGYRNLVILRLIKKQEVTSNIDF